MAITAAAAITFAVKCGRIEWQMCMDRPRMEDCLPLDTLEAIMGFLDRESICSARLVSKTFCAAASVHVCSLTIPSTSKALSFHRYSHLQHVSVTHDIPFIRDEDEESFPQLDPCLRDVAATLTVRGSATAAQTRGYLSQAALMPKLRGLFVEWGLVHEAALLARCTNLEAIRFRWCSHSVARAVDKLTRLTSLDLGYQPDDGSEDEDEDEDGDGIFWLERFRSLQAVRTWCSYASLPLIGNLTWLTGLTIRDNLVDYPTYSIAPLTRLTRLRSLNIECSLTQSNLAIACSLGLGSLVDLQLWASEDSSAGCGRHLSRQTALTQLSLRGWQLCELRHVGAFRIEQLQCLETQDSGELEAEDLSVLSRATSLTELSIDLVPMQMGLSQVLAGLTQLCSLSLQGCYWRRDAPNILDLPLALSPLTALTKLHLYAHRLDDGDLGAVLVLTGLRVLELSYCRLTDDVLPDLKVLTSLSSLTVKGSGVTSLAPVSEALDPLRNARGLPPLHTSMG